MAALARTWRKASYSTNGASCVEVRLLGTVDVRDTKLGDASPVLAFEPAAWTDFVHAVQAGQLDR